jgi:Na+/melibiose symporter-like transporter
LIGPVASVVLVGGILFARFCPLTCEAHAETRHQIAAQREANAD